MQKKYYWLTLYLVIIVLAFSSVSSVNAVDSLKLSVAKITAKSWSLNNAILSIDNLMQSSPRFSLLSARLTLPPPLDKITELSIRCQRFVWNVDFLDCSQGQGSFESGLMSLATGDLSFQVKNNKSNIKISQVPIFGGIISISAQELAGKWQVAIKAKGVDLVVLSALIDLDGIAITHGHADLEIQIKGEQGNIQQFAISALQKGISFHDVLGDIASEEATVKSEFSALRQNNEWQWHSNSVLQKGGLFIAPVYLNIDIENPVRLSANGDWLAEQKRLHINQFTLEHSQLITMEGSAILSVSNKAESSIEFAKVFVDIPELETAAPTYFLPFLESSEFDDIDLAGIVNAKLTVEHDALTNVSIGIKDLMLDDEQRLYINQANAQFNWAKRQKDIQPSFINWQLLKILEIPFQPGQLDFSSFAHNIELLKQANLQVLGGTLSINRFAFSTIGNDTDTTIGFEGSINNLSLEQLSRALGWTPLSGEISGYIPSVRYQDRTLSLDGELKMQVFDGDITINNLASSGLFSEFSQFYADIKLDHLDLAAITQKFQTGYIEGRLSGSVQKLYLENWQPVSFYAWIGTPDNDDSTHRISQKAVENIASIGGGNISDIMSRGFLGLFSTFSYSKLGIGCYLYQGICQLMGVEAVDNGFYLVKGGGLPRINVIGYNPMLDWNELLIRLNRITTSDQIIIE